MTNSHWLNDIPYIIVASWIMEGDGENLPEAVKREIAFVLQPLIERAFERFRHFYSNL